MTAPLDLLDEAARLLREDLAPALTGEWRYRALLAAKAVDTAQRELALHATLAANASTLPTAVAPLREGRHDNDGTLYATLLDAAIVRAHIGDPTSLTADERARLDALSR